VDDLNNPNGNPSTVRVRQRQGLVKKTSFSRDSRHSPVVPVVNVRPEAKGTFWINFIHLGRKHYTLTLWANSQLGMKKWTENIWKQQQVLRERSMLFDTVPLSEGYFTSHNKVNCAAPFRMCSRLPIAPVDLKACLSVLPYRCWAEGGVRHR